MGRWKIDGLLLDKKCKDMLDQLKILFLAEAEHVC